MQTCPELFLAAGTASLVLLASCGGQDIAAPTFGSLTITTTTQGDDLDEDGYLVSVDGGLGQAIANNGVTSVPGLPVGPHTIELSGIADNCTVNGDNPLEISVVADQTTPITLAVMCGRLPVLQGVILFQSDRSSVFPLRHLYRMKPDGSEVVDLTPTSDGEDGNASYDGRKIAFTSSRNGNADIFLMNADGSGVTQLTQDPADDTQPTWSPDGSRIAFVSTRGGRSNLWVMNANGSGVAPLFMAAGFQPSWSPDGSQIAFARVVRLCNFDVCAADIFVIPAGGGIAADLTHNASGVAYHPAWSPDGSRVAYEQDRQIWVMHGDGSEKTKVSRTNSQDVAPIWSPDGSQLAFTRLLDNAEVFKINLDGSAATNISKNPANDSCTSWR